MIRSWNWVARRWGRLLTSAGVLILLAVAVAPFIDAGAFAGRIRPALEATLGRSATFRAAHFTLLNGPGFSLSDVEIAEDPRFGAEPFAFVPTLDARIRLDRLLLGQIVVSSVRLVEPSVNVVRRDDGSWNVIELITRLSRPSRVDLNLFPAFEISDGRLDFKLGVRKTTLYVTDTDLSGYREKSGKLFLQFSGSPARTDRAGNGFGHLSGKVNWYLHPDRETGNQLEGDIRLDRSNLSELSTLFQGEDAGVHGTVSGRARIAGPAAALHVVGEMHLEDLHRWDLLPSSGEDWTVPYEGLIDLPARSIDLKTLAPEGRRQAVQLTVKGASVLSRPTWSLLANLNGAPVKAVLPLARRMGLNLPESVSVDGKMSGAIGYSTVAGWTGGVSMNDFTLASSAISRFHSDSVTAQVIADRIHLESARMQAGDGWLDVSGEYNRTGRGLEISLAMNEYPAQTLQNLFADWLQGPDALTSFHGGAVTGSLNYKRSAEGEAAWSGKFSFSDAEVAVEGIPDGVTEARGQIAFDQDTVDLDHFTGLFEKHLLGASFHSGSVAHKAKRLHVEWTGVDVGDVEKLLLPGTRQGWLARLGVARQSKPEWMASRNVEGDIYLANLTVAGTPFGSLRTRVHWVGPSIELTALRVQLPQGQIEGAGTISLSGTVPRYRLTASLMNYPWRGGLVSAEGRLDAAGSGNELLLHTLAEGRFSGQDVVFGPDAAFRAMSGAFQLSFADRWPDLRLTNVEAADGEEEWTGTANSQSDGKLVLDLQHAGRQKRIVSPLSAEPAAGLSAASRSARLF